MVDSEPRQHSQETAPSRGIAQRKVLPLPARIDIGPEDPVPDGEYEPEVPVRKATGTVVKPVEVRGDNQPLNRSEIHPQICMNPNIDNHANRKTDACLCRGKGKEIVADKDLRHRKKKQVGHARS